MADGHTKEKQDIVKVGDLWPLILVDSIRKLWCKILLQRILEVGKQNDGLRHALLGFCVGGSTMTASLMFINMLEETIEKGEFLHTCSWDITRAFDSVSKNVMHMAWTRLGVQFKYGASTGARVHMCKITKGRRYPKGRTKMNDR